MASLPAPRRVVTSDAADGTLRLQDDKPSGFELPGGVTMTPLYHQEHFLSTAERAAAGADKTPAGAFIIPHGVLAVHRSRAGERDPPAFHRLDRFRRARSRRARDCVS
ncbi:hypothetical protein P7C73_g5633, partial [Tremellales sp. Uapishka_1]